MTGPNNDRHNQADLYPEYLDVALGRHAALVDLLFIAAQISECDSAAVYLRNGRLEHCVASFEFEPTAFTCEIEHEIRAYELDRMLRELAPDVVQEFVGIAAPGVEHGHAAGLLTREGVHIGQLVVLGKTPIAMSELQKEAVERVACQIVLLLEAGAEQATLRSAVANRRRVIQILENRAMLLERKSREVAARNAVLERMSVDWASSREVYEYASQRFLELFQSLPVAAYCYDERGRIFEWNRAFELLYAINKNDILELPMWETINKQEDEMGLRDVVARVFSGELVENREWAGVKGDGSECIVLCNTFPLRHANGSIVGGISANVDITQRKVTENALKDSETRYRSVTDSAYDAILTLDVHGAVLYWNHGASVLFGFDMEQGLLLNLQDIIPSFAHVGPDAGIDWSLCVGKSSETVAIKNTGVGVPVELSVANWDSHGETFYTTIIRDVSDRKAQEEHLQEKIAEVHAYTDELEFHKSRLETTNAKLETLAKLDGMTGLKNHRAFKERLDVEFERARRYSLPLSLLLLDVDHFKAFNDQFGHLAGDDVLKMVAFHLEENARHNDVVARYGGEEFVVILPHTDLEGAEMFAERCRKSLEEATWPLRSITASFGVVQVTARIESAMALIEEADRAMYVAKSTGRNRVSAIRVGHDTSIVKAA